jgi:hypothetical protein
MTNRQALKLAAVVTTAAAIAPTTANARVIGIKLTQTRIKQRVVPNPLNPAAPRPTLLPGDILWSQHNLLWLGNRLGYAPQPWPVGFAVITCKITAYPRAQCSARYMLAGGTIVAGGPLNLLTRSTQRARISAGTRRYRGARGSITVQFKTPTVRVLRFTVST